MSEPFTEADARQTVVFRGGDEDPALALRTKNDSYQVMNRQKLNKTFRFILVDDSNPERRKKNRSIAHSHVKRIDRRRKREQQIQRKQQPKGPVVGVVEPGIDEDALDELWSDHSRCARAWSADSSTSWKPSVSGGEALTRLGDTGGSISTLSIVSANIDLPFSPALAGVFGIQDPRTRQILDHALNVLWPGFMPGVTDGASHPLSAAWFQAICRSRALFHSVVVVAARHLDFLRKSTSYSDSRLALAHKGRAMQELRYGLADPAQASKDENILAMLWMASAEILPEDRKEASVSAFNPPLPSDQWIDAWASATGTEHSNMMRELTEIRGGLENIRLFGLAKVLSLATTILVTSRLVQLYHPFPEDVAALQPMSRRFVDQKYISRTLLNNVVSTYTETLSDLSHEEPQFWSGFRGLAPLGLTEQALSVFRDLRGYSALVEKYCCGATWAYTQMEIVDMRNAVQHRLASLPLGSDLSDVTMQQAGIYECCRLTALLYACAVTFPLPSSTGWDRNLVRGIKQTLENLSLESWPVYRSDLHLWVLILAGMAACQTGERAWFVGKLRGLALRHGLSEWGQVLPVLKSFVWMDMACGAGGMSLWDEVQGWTPETGPSEVVEIQKRPHIRVADFRGGETSTAARSNQMKQWIYRVLLSR